MNEKREFIRQFKEVQPKFSRLYARILTQAGLSLSHFALLSQLASGEPVSMTEISARLHVSKPAVTHLVDRLEKEKFLKRIPHAQDRRVSLLQILPRGRSVVQRTQGQALSFLLKALDPLSASERKTITRFYALLAVVMEEALGKGRRL